MRGNMVMYMSSRKPGIETFSRDELDQLHRSAESVINSIDPTEEVTKAPFSMSGVASATDGSAFLHSSGEKFNIKEVHARAKTSAGDYVANAYQNRNPDSAVKTSTTVERDGKSTEIKDPRAVKLVASLAAKQLKRKAGQPDTP